MENGLVTLETHPDGLKRHKTELHDLADPVSGIYQREHAKRKKSS